MFDLGADPLKYYQDRIHLAKDLWDNIFMNFEVQGGSYKKLMTVFNQGWTEYRVTAHNASKYVGGLYAHRDHIGDPNGRSPFEIVPAAKQQQALDELELEIKVEDED